MPPVQLDLTPEEAKELADHLVLITGKPWLRELGQDILKALREQKSVMAPFSGAVVPSDGNQDS